MKKFCFLVLSGIFTLACFVAQAQTYNSITSNPGNLTFDDPSFWQGGVAPTTTCNDCIITVSADVTMVPDDGSSSTGATPGSEPGLNSLVFIGGSLTVTNNATLTINTYVQFFLDAYFQVGQGSSLSGTVNLNDQVRLNDASVVRLANINSSISTANLDGHDPIIGPNVDYTHTSTSPGLFYELSPPEELFDVFYDFSVVLSSLYIGTPLNEYPGDQYTFNCDDGGPNDCINGIVYGPAITSVVNPYGVVFGPALTLPVNLVQFIATKNPDASVKLSWSTAQEINSSSFEVERSADQGDWEKIGSVAAKGYSSITSNYSFTDQFPLSGNGYYRLKMIDLDGKFKYSNTLVVSSDKDGRPLVIYSNPFSDQIRMKVNVSRAQKLSLTVSDIIGKTYLKQSYNAQAGENLINLVPAGAAGGMYILHIQGSTYEQTVKLVKH